MRDEIRLDLINLIQPLFFSSPADNRPSGKSPVGTVQEPPSKLPGEKTLLSYFSKYFMNPERLRGPFIPLASSEIKDLVWFLVFSANIRRFNTQDCDASWLQWHHDPLIRHYTVDPFCEKSS